MTNRPTVNRVQPNVVDKTQLIPVQYEALQNSGATPGSLTVDMVRREPQWLHQITVVDKPATTGFVGISSYTQVERINWEVTENFLIARKAYDHLVGAEAGPARPQVGQNPHVNEILAVYRIDSHFDIRRQYNTTTGEEQNVVEENSSDRPWYLRRYMRIDWSQNLVSGYSVLMYNEWQGRVRSESVATYFNNPEDPNRPVFDYGDFNGQTNVLRYFDITNRSVIHPEEARLDGYPNAPACILYDNLHQSCQPVDLLMRVSFRRVDPMRDYQPVNMDGHRFDRYGFFDVDRHGYDPHLNAAGQLYRRHFAARHNIWQQHHVSVPNNGLDHHTGDPTCQSDGDCVNVSATARCDATSHTCGEVYVRCNATANDQATVQQLADEQCNTMMRGSQCDLDIAYNRGDSLGLCLLPYRQRTVRQIPYHLSPNYPERMMSVTRQVVSEWNRVFTYAVRQARVRECLLENPGQTQQCAAEADAGAHPNAEVPGAEQGDARFVYVGCHNPVWGSDPNLPGFHTQGEVDAAYASGWDLPSCGAQGTVARLGDIRYSMIASINEYDQQGPWGLAGISGDPITGEVYAGRGAVWQTVTDGQAAFATDLMRLLNGDDTSTTNFALGSSVIAAYDASMGRGREPADGQTGGAGRDPNTRVIGDHPRPVHRDISSQAELDTMLAQSRMEHFANGPNSNIPEMTPETFAANSQDTDGRHTPAAAMRNLGETYRDALPHAAPGNDATTRLRALRGTSVERVFVNRESLLAAGFDPEQSASDDALESVSPARRNNRAVRAMREAMEVRSSILQCNYDSDAQFNDDAVSALLTRFRRNQVPADVQFGNTAWNFRAQGASEADCMGPVVVRTEADANGVSRTRSNCPLNYAVVQEYLTQYIHYGVLAHEIGHSVGERHNFSGSADAVNYFDQYWRLRRTASGTTVAADQIQPRWTHMAAGRPFYSTEEEQGGIVEYEYSTVMDYKGWNGDAHGLGRYDRAFVMHGYVDMVEAFNEIAPGAHADALTVFENMTGGVQGALSFMTYGTPARNTTPHYTEIPRLVGLDNDGNPRLGDSNRYPVFLRETRRRQYNGNARFDPDHTNISCGEPDGRAITSGTCSSDPTERRAGGTDEHVLVPFRFNTDGYRGTIWNNLIYDTGPDQFEVARYLSTRFLDYYFSSGFARNRQSFTVNGYRNGVHRWLDPLTQIMRGHAYYSAFYLSVGIPANNTIWTSAGAQAGTLAMATASDALANAIVMPRASAVNTSAGAHCRGTRADGSVMWDQRTCTSGQINLQVGQGREYSTYFDYASGQYWRERIVSAGSYHDQEIAIDAMTDPFYIPPDRTVTEVVDPHRLEINAYTVYPGQTLRFFGSLLSRDHADIGALVRPTTNGEADVIRTRYSLLNLPAGTGASQNGRDPTLNAVAPTLGYTVEAEAAAYLFAQLGSALNHTASQSARMWAEGDPWAVSASAARTLVTFTDPLTGLTYSAVHVGGTAGELGASTGLSARDAGSNETGIAARMLLQARRLAATWTTSRTADAQRALQSYVDLLNEMRELSRIYPM